MKLRPLGKNVLIEPVEAKPSTDNLIHVPFGDRTGPRRGRILAVSEEAAKLVDVGAAVLFERNAPSVDAGGGRLIVDVDHVVAVLS